MLLPKLLPLSASNNIHGLNCNCPVLDEMELLVDELAAAELWADDELLDVMDELVLAPALRSIASANSTSSI